VNGAGALQSQDRAAVISRLEDLRTREKNAPIEARQEIALEISRLTTLLQKIDGAITETRCEEDSYKRDSTGPSEYDEINTRLWLEREQNRLKEIAAERDRQERLTVQCRDGTVGCAYSDIGNARRFIIRHHRNVRYCAPWRKWLIWDGARWAIDDRNEILRLAKDTALRIADEARIQDTPQEVLRWAAASQNHARIMAMVDLSKPECAILPENFDANPNLLNFPNGTLDIRTFMFREHRREDLCTKVMGCIYDPDAQCPTWLEHLHIVFAGDETFIHSFRLMCGYSLLANNPEQVLFVLHGGGKNGKSVTIGTLRRIWGEYGWNLAADSLLARKHADACTPRSDLAALKGVRLATASESDGGTRLSEATVKILTGGDDVLTVRRLYSEEFSFKPGAKIWLVTNHLPTVRGTDEAIWRRIWLVPFTVTIPEDKRDPMMGDKLYAEASGILNWCLEGFREYMQAGRLVRPEIVTQATDAYREDQDILADFLAEYCDVGEGYECTAKELYQAYRQWCAWDNEEPLKPRTFGMRMGERFQRVHTRLGKVYKGVKIRSQSNIIKNNQNTPCDGKEARVTDKFITGKSPLKESTEYFTPFLNYPSPSVTEPVKSRSDLSAKCDPPSDSELTAARRDRQGVGS